ncbi:unnamed protein product [Oreochromis niloticus]|nr:unnamed protein product [Mustela putorius furo]
MDGHGGHWISGSVVDLRVRSGENVTLNCDCKTSTNKEYIVWYRNCTHENQPPLVLKQKEDPWKQISDQKSLLNSLARFHFVENNSSGSYDLLIMNISDSDEGLYYCGTEKDHLEEHGSVQVKYVHRYSNIRTRILINASDTTSTHERTPQVEACGMCWKLLFVLCPTFAVVPSLLVSLLVHHYCQKTVDHQRPKTSQQTRKNQDEDVFYATVETRQATQRQKKKITHSSDFCTYSAINTSGL